MTESLVEFRARSGYEPERRGEAPRGHRAADPTFCTFGSAAKQAVLRLPMAERYSARQSRLMPRADALFVTFRPFLPHGCLLRRTSCFRVNSGQGAIAPHHHPRDKVENMIGFIVAGLVIGALARFIKPGKQNLSLFVTLLLGLAGSIIGGVIANLLGTGNIFELNVLGFVVAVIAAVLLVGTAESLAGRRNSGR